MAKAKMTKPEILAVFDAVKNLEKMRESVKRFITDKKNPFEDRLEIYLTTPAGLRGYEQWILHLDEFEDVHGEINWFDDFYCERHQEVELRDCMKEKENHSGTQDWSDEKYRAFQEAVLNKGVHSFTLDW